MPLTNKSQESKLEDKKVLHCEVDINGYNFVFSNLMRNRVCGNKCQSQVAVYSLKTLNVFKSGGIIDTMIFLLLLIFLL